MPAITNCDLRAWFERTLAHFQSKELDDTAVDNVIKLLTNCGAIKLDDGKMTATSVGVISSMFYFSPFDVSHLKRNFRSLFEHGREDDDLFVALALGNIDSHRTGFASRAEKEEMAAFERRVRAIVPPEEQEKMNLTDGAMKAAFMYNCLLTGAPTSILAGVMRGIQHDSPRLLAVVQALDSMGGKWGKRSYLETLEKRIRYGVPQHLIELVSVPHLGHVRANNLYKAGIKTLEDLVEAKPEDLMKITKMSRKLVDEVIEEANIKMATT
jgi:replicative superfamily II helicase